MPRPTREPGRAGPPPPDEEEASLVLAGEEVRARSPEGEHRMPLADFLTELRAGMPDTAGHILPDGVKACVPTRRGVLVVHQTQPRVHPVRWIKRRNPLLEEPRYRVYRIALPYVITLAAFQRVAPGVMGLSHHNEVFFSNEPLTSFDQKLCFPALLNCGPISDARGGNWASWVCTGNLRRSRPPRGVDPIAHGLNSLVRHLFESGFNHAVDHLERPSWYTATIQKGVDERLATMEGWQAASDAEGIFALEVPWLPTGKTLADVVERMQVMQDYHGTRLHDLLVMVANHRPRRRFSFRRQAP